MFQVGVVERLALQRLAGGPVEADNPVVDQLLPALTKVRIGAAEALRGLLAFRYLNGERCEKQAADGCIQPS